MGGRIRGLGADPSNPGVLYAGTFDGRAIFKSTNGGATWTTVNTGLSVPDAVEAIAVDSHGTVYVGANGGLLKGSAQGSSWSAAQGVSALVSSITIASPSVIYAATRGQGVLRSSDGGATFQPVNSGLTATDFVSIARDPSGNLYAGASGIAGVFKTDSTASNWSPMNTGLPQSGVDSLVADSSGSVYASVAGGVYKTTDGGAHWNPANSGLSVSGPFLAMDSGGAIYALAEGSHLFKSTDGAASWSSVNSGVPVGVVTNVLAVDSSGNTIYAGTEQGVLKTTSGFASWTSASGGLIASEVYGLAFDPAVAGTLYASSFGAGVYKSTDNGSTWSLLSEPMLYPLPVRVDSGGQVIAGGDFGLKRSTDHGATWSVPSGSPLARIWALDVSSSTYYAAGPGIRRSTDNGATWNATVTGLDGLVLMSVAADPSNGMLVYAGSSGHGLFKSIDAGATWTPAGTGFNGSAPTGLAVDSSGAVYAGAETGVFKSNDHGSTWTLLANGVGSSISSVVVDPSDSTRVYAAGSVVFRSTDGGASWAQLDSSGYPSGFTTWTLALDPANQGSIYAGTLGQGVLRDQIGAGPAIATAVFTPPKKLVISGTGFSDSPTVKINGADVSAFIRSASDTSIAFKAKSRNLGLVSGANSVQVFDKSGAASPVFTLNF
jgi:photosystem II stability/assembly factor-like uncharacterized protein